MEKQGIILPFIPKSYTSQHSQYMSLHPVFAAQLGSFTGSTSGPSTSRHCRESQEYTSPDLGFCLGEFWTSLDCLNESSIWCRDLADQNLAEPLAASAGETFHTQNIKALSVYSEQSTQKLPPGKEKSTKSWKAYFSVVVQQFLLKDYLEIRAAEEYCLFLILPPFETGNLEQLGLSS